MKKIQEMKGKDQRKRTLKNEKRTDPKSSIKEKE